ncbi:LysR family transcriptional regulator [Serratia sp. IR-2025]
MNDARYVEHLPIFLDVARLGSFSAAARRLGMVPSSLVRHIDALESALGAALFVRSTRGLLLTDAGELLLTRAAALMTDITGLRAELSALNETPQGTLRISCLPTFGKTYVLPLLPTLAERYPQLSVDLDLTERLTDPTQERLDAAIRIGEQKDSALYASRIATQRWVMCASPAYVARYGLPADLEALPQHRLIARYHKQQPACWAQILDAALMSRCTMARGAGRRSPHPPRPPARGAPPPPPPPPGRVARARHRLPAQLGGGAGRAARATGANAGRSAP